MLACGVHAFKTCWSVAVLTSKAVGYMVVEDRCGLFTVAGTVVCHVVVNTVRTCPLTVSKVGSQVNVSLYLVGENTEPVTASLNVFQRSPAGVSNAALPDDLVLDEALYWDAAEYGSPKTITVSLPQAVSCQGDPTLSSIALRV